MQYNNLWKAVNYQRQQSGQVAMANFQFEKSEGFLLTLYEKLLRCFC